MRLSSPGTPTSFTFATLPATAPAGKTAWISNIGNAVIGASPVAATGSLWVFNGTIWRPVGGRVDLAKLNTAITGLTNVEAVSAQLLLPAAFLTTGDRLSVTISGTKSGTTDTSTVSIRMGTAGTTADTQLNSGQVMTAPNILFRGLFDFRVDAATTIARTSIIGGGVGGSGSAAADVTIANISNALFINFGLVSSAGNDTVGLRDIVLTLIR